MKKVAVIGAGVIGLTSAICLQDAGYQVSIFTKEMPQYTTSSAAGAIWWGYGDGKIREWAERSLKNYISLIEDKNSGVQWMRMRDVYRYSVALPWFRAELPYCERIPGDELKPPYVDGFIMEIPIVEAPRYLSYLQTRFQQNAGTIIQQEIESFSELASEYPIIVNCSGVGARELAEDTAVYPIRGQTVILDAPEIQEGYTDDEAFTYIYIRSDGVLLGGVKQAEMSTWEVDSATRDDILARCSAVDARVNNRPIIKETVGFRPGRYAVRLEAEQFSDDGLLIHNYGHGGTGFTLSWGCAENVLQLVQKVVD